jgi:hypothetical protein
MEQELKPARWLPHALKNLIDREIPRQEAEHALANPERIGEGNKGRRIFMRRYFDERLGQEMLLRVVVEEGQSERVITTVYITSKIGKYMGEANR